MSVMPGRLPPTLLMMRCRALPMQALARLPLPKVLVPALMPSRLTMGPLTMTSTESGLVVVATPRRSNSGWLTASTAATSKGMCLGVDRDLPHCGHPVQRRECGDGEVVRQVVSGEHGFDAFWGGRHERQPVAPAPGEEQGVERLKSVACGFDGFGVRAGEVHGGAGR